VTNALPVITQKQLRLFLKREARHWGSNVRARRLELGLTLEELAGLADTTPQTVFKVERGEIVARDYLRLSLAFALGRESFDLFPLPRREVILEEVAA
jgi:transcriptional regulator with XRE-family HTH domain